MRSPVNKQNGMVAIFDALGAASYSDKEIQRFLWSRDHVLKLLGEKIEHMPRRIAPKDIKIFTFNDTILIAYTTNAQQPNLNQITSFFIILRRFLVDSLRQKILFRGSVSIGTFYVDDKSNTVMGQAVTDAAAWYDKADWIGVQATPKATIVVQRWLEKHRVTRKLFILDYDVPISGGGKSVRVKALNWPMLFLYSSVKPKEKILQLLSEHSVPLGTEQKFFNTIAFFDHVVEKMQKKIVE